MDEANAAAVALTGHGLVTGLSELSRADATRALLRDLVTGCPPERLNLLLVDPADGPLFDGCEELPQLAHLLRGEAAFDHTSTALHNESQRRTALLRSGGFRTRADYLAATGEDPDAEPMAELVVVLNKLSRLHRVTPWTTDTVRDNLAGWRERGIRLLVLEDRAADLPEGLAEHFGFELATGESGHELRVSGAEPVAVPAVAVPELPKPEPGAVPRSLLLRPWTERPPLDALLNLTEDEARGLHDPAAHWINPVIGVVERPFGNTRTPHHLSLETGDGHALFVGEASAGLGELLRTTALSLALGSTPEELELHVLDFVGDGLADLAALPHTVFSATPEQAGLFWYAASELAGLVQRRQQQVVPFGTRDAAVVIVHGWYGLRAHPDLLNTVIDLVHRGHTAGVHVVLGIHRWSELDPSLADAFGTRLELRLSAPHFSAIDPQRAAKLPVGKGHGLTWQNDSFLAASPDCQDHRDPVAAIAEAWRGPRQRVLRLLPERLAVAEVPAGEKLPLGIVEPDWRGFGLGESQHLLCLGEEGAGKTNLVNAVVDGIKAAYTPEQALIVIVDPRRTMLGRHDGKHLLEYVVSQQRTKAMVAEVRESLLKRRGAAEWRGPELFLVLDDFERSALDGYDAILDLLPHARQIGLHVVMAGMYHGGDRVELAKRLPLADTLALLLSGDPEQTEPVTGLRPYRVPPGRALMSRHGQTWLVQTGLAPGDPA
ncbi:type VII secretion protein EccCb [Crossiella equi]|uniref:Type VII secretion protein EccCb n=1 Tax=Crossiella equi TaxID=130796 RepID=A0ABS5ACY8_9PSEU|nr:FtsK/SpoIIIE domain-containing protein [Crossiella equi]MBP2474457.1 type VII secretion protein EccCb [Crossiella equi]